MENAVNPDRLDLLVLIWLWCQRGKPAKQTGVVTGIKSFLVDGSASELVAIALERLAGQIDRIAPAKKRGIPEYRINPVGHARVTTFLEMQDPPSGAKPFTPVSNVILPAKVMRLPIPPDKKALAAFGKLLPLAICVQHFGLEIPMDQGRDAAKLTLVKLGLAKWNGVPVERIYVKKLPSGELPALIAGPLLDAGGTAATNLDKIIEASAGKILHVTQTAKMKMAVVRCWLYDDGQASKPTAASNSRDVGPAPSREGKQFAAQVRAAAKSVASTGGVGVNNLGDQVLIEYCWREYQRLFGAIAFEHFREHLVEANNRRELVLVREDLIPEGRSVEFRESEVLVGASSYHYVRIQP